MSASPVFADGKIYFFGEDGEAPVIAADREFKLLANNKLDSGAMASPAVVGKSLIVRVNAQTHQGDLDGTTNLGRLRAAAGANLTIREIRKAMPIGRQIAG